MLKFRNKKSIQLFCQHNVEKNVNDFSSNIFLSIRFIHMFKVFENVYKIVC